MINTSTTAPMTKNATANNVKSRESFKILSLYSPIKLLFIIATEIIPPAKPAKKYARISKTP